MDIPDSPAAMARPVRQIVLVSPQQFYLDALQRLLASPAYSILGAGRTLEEALRGRAPHGPLSMIVFNLDADEDVERELDGIRAVRARHPGARVVVLANCRLAATKLQVVRAGAQAILSRDISVDVLRSSLELVLLGTCIVPDELAHPVLEQPPRPPDAPPLPSPPRGGALLSGREQQILQCLISGLTNKGIARDLDISEATVKVHIKALLRKTRLTNRTQAAIWALNNPPGGRLLLSAMAAAQGAACRPEPLDA